MRTTKRFTPDLLDRFRSWGRGTGTYKAYIPWHRVSRSDPASRGRSHILRWGERQVELLSDGEMVAFCFSWRMLKLNDDAREQLPLAQESAPHELTAYDVRLGCRRYPGTLEIAKELGIKHPIVRGKKQSAPWVMTTDLVLMLKGKDDRRALLAIATKDKRAISRRARALLNIERTYWHRRGVPWLLITPHQYHPTVAETLQRAWYWALEERVGERELLAAEQTIRWGHGRNLTYLLTRLSDTLGDWTVAQHALWQAILSGRVAVDLRRGWRPHLPLQIISQADFDALNPILMRRSAWS